MPRHHPTLFLLIFFLWQMPAQAYTVKGNIDLGAEWEPKIYLSLIPSFDDLNTASADLIVNMAEIDSEGNFLLEGQNLPVDPRIYRLHVCKKDDPPATLFIGGQEENHFHIIMDNGSEINFRSSGLFQDAIAEGHSANDLWKILDDNIQALRKIPEVNSRINRENREQQLSEFLMSFSDTCSHAIPAMYAISQLDLESFMMTQPELANEKMEAWSFYSSSPYFSEIQKQIDILRHSNRRSKKSWLMEGLLVLGLVSLFYFFRKKISVREESFRPKADLSVQERRVLKLLSGGKSNKEISEELHIEVSTVKSHVSKIYSKLGVRSRKEVVGRF